MGVAEPDYDLPWVRLKDEPQEGPPRLNRQNMFLLACREAFASGSLTDKEKAFLSKFAGALKIPKNDARGFARLAKQEADEGKLKGDPELDPKIVFKKACAMAGAKGKILQEERQILGQFSEALGIPMMREDATIKQMAVKIEESAREVKTEIKLAADRNMDGSSMDLSQSWGDGDPLTQSGIMRLGVDLPMRPGEARAVGSAPIRRAPRKPSGPPPELVTQARIAAGIRVAQGLAVGAVAGYGFHQSWFATVEGSLLGLLLSLVGLLMASVFVISGGFRVVFPKVPD